MTTAVQNSSAVLVIDVQVGLIQGSEPVFRGPAVVARIRTMTDRARQAGVPIFVLDKDVAPPDSPDWQLHPGLGAREDDPRVRKAYSDSFYRTDLRDGEGKHEILAQPAAEIEFVQRSRQAQPAAWGLTSAMGLWRIPDRNARSG